MRHAKSGLWALLTVLYLACEAATAAGPVRIPLAESDTVSFKGGLSEFYSAEFSPDGKTLALGGRGSTVELWDVATGKLRAALRDHPRDGWRLAFSPDGKTLAVASYKQVILWDTASGKELRTLKGHTDAIYFVGFLADGKTLVTACPRDEAAHIRLWDAETGEPLASFAWSNADGGLLTTDGKTLCVNGGNNVGVFDMALRKPAHREIEGAYGWLTSRTALSPDNRLMASGRGENVVSMELATGIQTKVHALHTDKVVSVAFSPDGAVLATGSADRTAILWDRPRKKEIATLKGHAGPVSVLFSPDGKTLYTFSPGEANVRAWEADTGKERGVFAGPKAGLQLVRLSTDGRVLAGMYRDGTVQLWDTERARVSR
jgi:WD40 repeat protein